MRPRRGGRPRRSVDDMSRLVVLVTAAERRDIEARAAAAGLSRSGYLRRAALGPGRVAAAADLELLRQAVTQLRLAGVNLNALVRDGRLMAAGLVPRDSPTAGRCEDVLAALDAARRRFDDVLRRMRGG